MLNGVVGQLDVFLSAKVELSVTYICFFGTIYAEICFFVNVNKAVRAGDVLRQSAESFVAFGVSDAYAAADSDVPQQYYCFAV